MYNPSTAHPAKAFPTASSSIPPQCCHTSMMTACQLLPSTQHLHPQHSCYRLAFRSVIIAPLVKVPLMPQEQLKAHSRSTWRTSVPSLLSAPLPIAYHPSNFVEQLVLRPRGTCCSCSKEFVSSCFHIGPAPQLPAVGCQWKNGTYVRPDAFHANAIVCDGRL